MDKTAIIIGASGLVGNELLKQLLLENSFKLVTVFVRKPLPINHSKLQQQVIDFNTISNYSHLIKADVIFCCLGTTIKTAGSKEAFKKVDYEYPLQFAEAAKQNGCEAFVVISSLGANKSASNFYLKVKGEMEGSLRNLNFKKLLIVRPSMLLGERVEFRAGEKMAQKIMQVFSFLFVGPLKKFKAIEASVVAKAMISLSTSELKGVNVIESDRLQPVITYREVPKR